MGPVGPLVIWDMIMVNVRYGAIGACGAGTFGATGVGARCGVGYLVHVGPSWAEPDLHEKQEVGCHSYTQFCSTANFLQPNQIAAFRLECNHPDHVVASSVCARSRTFQMPIAHDVSLSVPRWTF